MNKKNLIIIGIFLVIGIAIVAGIYFFFIKPQQVTPLSQIQVQPTAAPSVEMTQWIDQSEFRFDYPKDLTINPHEEDQTNYAHVELTHTEHPGRIIVWAKDTNSKTIDEWMDEQAYAGAIDTTLGGEPAKKALVTGPPSKILIATIRNGYLYIVEAEVANDSYWNDVYDGIVSTFTFFTSESKETNTSQQNNVPAPPASDVEEETIE